MFNERAFFGIYSIGIPVLIGSVISGLYSKGQYNQKPVVAYLSCAALYWFVSLKLYARKYDYFEKNIKIFSAKYNTCINYKPSLINIFQSNIAFLETYQTEMPDVINAEQKRYAIRLSNAFQIINPDTLEENWFFQKALTYSDQYQKLTVDNYCNRYGKIDFQRFCQDAKNEYETLLSVINPIINNLWTKKMITGTLCGATLVLAVYKNR